MIQKLALINSTKEHTQKSMLREKETEPGLVASYNIRPGNGAGLFLQPQSPHGAFIQQGLIPNGPAIYSQEPAGSQEKAVYPPCSSLFRGNEH